MLGMHMDTGLSSTNLSYSENTDYIVSFAGDVEVLKCLYSAMLLFFQKNQTNRYRYIDIYW